MELLDRYLQAVRFWLPKAQQQDIIAELSSDLQSQIEDREMELGRALNDADLETILRKCGSPILVASRYRPQSGQTSSQLDHIAAIVNASVLLTLVVMWLGFCIAGIIQTWQLMRLVRRRSPQARDPALLRML